MALQERRPRQMARHPQGVLVEQKIVQEGLSGSTFHYSYLGHFLQTDSEELISIVRTKNRIDYEFWNETLGVWREPNSDSFGERQTRIHDTRLEENRAKVVFPNAFR